nr:adult-specific protein A5 [Ischnura senegalensis]
MVAGLKIAAETSDGASLVENEIITERFRYINDEMKQIGTKEINNDAKENRMADVTRQEPIQTETVVDYGVCGEEFLQVLLEGATVPLNTQVPMNSRPPWMDAELMKKGREFGMKYLFGIVYAQMLSLAILFSFRGGLEPLIFTGKSGTPFTAFQRYLSTVFRVLSWYQSDVFDEDSEAHKNMAVVRNLHASISRRMNEANRDDLKSKVTLEGKEIWCTHLETLKKDLNEFNPDCLSCPFLEISSLARNDFTEAGKAVYVNQLDLSVTQFGFVALGILYPQQFGVHDATEEDFRGFVHLWRCLGYLLGIEDRYNICSSEDLEVTRARCRAVVEKWAKPSLKEVTPDWEHMFRCVVEGISYYVPGNNFSVAVAYLLWVLDIPYSNLLAKMTWMERMLFHTHCFVLNYMMRIPGYLRFSNFLLDRSLRRARNPSIEWLREKREKVYDYQKLGSPTVETGS